MTALAWAADLCDRDQMRQLLQKGADPGLALQFHVFDTLPELKLLLSRGSDWQEWRSSAGSSLLRIVIRGRGYSTAVLELLSEYIPNVHTINEDGDTLLLLCTNLEKVDYTRGKLRWLLDRGIDQGTVDKEGHIALNYALEHQNPDLQILLESQDCPSNHTTTAGDTFLHFAAMYCDQDALEMLKDSRLEAAAHALNSVGWSAGRFARWRRDCNDDWGLLVKRSPDADPVAWYKVFKAVRSAFEERDILSAARRIMAGELVEVDPIDPYASMPGAFPL